MDFSIKSSFLTEKKQLKNEFPFFLTNLPSSSPITHSYLAMPSIPLLGKYSRDGYIIDEVKGLTILSINTDIFSNETYFIYDKIPLKISLPLEIKTLLNTIPDKIPHNKPLNTQKNQKNQKNSTFISKKPEIFEFHPYKFSSFPLIKFIWSITFPSKFFEKPDRKNDDYKNIINHTWVFEEFDFSQKKKLIDNIPGCVIIPKNIQKSCGIHQYFTDNKGINFGFLRSEYLSTHLIQGALCLSPNNMRIIIDKTQVLSHFWEVFLKKKEENLVVYQWVFNEMDEIFMGFLKEAKTIGEFLIKCSEILGEKHEAIQQIKDLFI